MPYHTRGHAGAVAVSYSTNTMPTPLSPNRRYSSGNTGTATSGIGSSSTKLSSYRSSASNSFDRPSYYSSSLTSSSGYGSTHRSSHSSEYRHRFCSPARSVLVSSSSFSETGSGGSSGGLSGNSSSGNSRYSTSSSRDTRSETRETHGSLASSAADLYAKYSPAHYVPNISGSNERHSQSANAATAAAAGGLVVNGYQNSTGVNNICNSTSAAIFGGNSTNAKISALRESANELSAALPSSSIIHGRPPRARRSPVSTLINNHAQPDSAANEVTELDLNGDKNKNDDNNNNNNESGNSFANGNEYDERESVEVSRLSQGNFNLDYDTVLSSSSEIHESLISSETNDTCLSSFNSNGAGVKINSACSVLPTNKHNHLLFTNNEVTNNNIDTDERALAGNKNGQTNTTSVYKKDIITATLAKEEPGFFELSNPPGELSANSNSFDIAATDTGSSIYSAVRKNAVSRPGGNQAGDNYSSLPSTSRRGDSYSPNGSGSNGSNGIPGNTSLSATAQQNIYRGIAADQVEGSPTIRAPRNRLQTPRDERCGLNGLRNIGNTCFMNSVIQCLSNTRPLLEYLVNEQYLADINTATSSMKGALIKAFSQVIQELWEVGGDHVVNTASLKSQIQRFAPRFMGYSQQDAQEFLRYLLEGLHEDVNRVTVKPQPIHTDIPEHYTDSQKAAESWKRYLRNEDSTIVDVFVGQLRSSLHCTSCGHVSVTLDPFWDLSLPIPTRSGTVKLNQCLEHFTREEVLDGDEKPTCSKCQTRRKCTKSFSIQKFPKILVIHLKRFSPMERFRGKLNTLVDFPLTGLDLGAFSAPRVAGCTYNLYGVANHSGTTYSGHYTAYCKHPYSGEWHEYNDSRVSSIAAKSVVSSEGYVLFYEQQPHSSNL